MFGACDRTAKRLFEGAKQALGWTSAADVPQPDSRASLSEAARPFAKEFDKKAMVWELKQVAIVLLDSTKGSLYPIKEKVKPFGFTYVRDFNGIPGADYWVAPATGLDTEALAALLDDWGWAATIYDGAD